MILIRTNPDGSGSMEWSTLEDLEAFQSTQNLLKLAQEARDAAVRADTPAPIPDQRK